MAADPTVEDITAMRAQGDDFREYLRMRLAAGRRQPEPPQQTATHTDYGPLHRPGAWPAGTRTDRPTCHPDCDCSLTSHAPEENR